MTGNVSPAATFGPAFLAPNEPAPVEATSGGSHTERNFERMVTADLRDGEGTGSQHAVLRSKENRARWLGVLLGIRAEILSHHTRDNAALKSHPEKPAVGESPSRAYLEAKKAMERRRLARENVLRAVTQRIREARNLIGLEPLAQSTAGMVVHQLIEIDVLVRDGNAAHARQRITSLLRRLTDQGDHEDTECPASNAAVQLDVVQQPAVSATRDVGETLRW